MNRGRVYLWVPQGLSRETVPLPRLDADGFGPRRLRGRFVHVRNGFTSDAVPDAQGDFLFDPGDGGGRMDEAAEPDWPFLHRYVEASHFGEANAYFHLDRIAGYVDGLLRELGSPPLPRVTAIVHAHNAACGSRDGVLHGERRVAFQGGHYRLPSESYDLDEHAPISSDGEIHLGPGHQLLQAGPLAQAAGGRYRANASHDAGILYHQYGHHLCRHTADFRANALLPAARQDNRKTALDQGTADYWAAALLGTPDIWALHHDPAEPHPRSLVPGRTMTDFQTGPAADAHANGTIWASALWELRSRMAQTEADGARRMDRIVLQSLLLLGLMRGEARPKTPQSVRRARESFDAGLRALVLADQLLHGDSHRRMILWTMGKRGIHPESSGVAEARG
jgi:hypothetical protein